MFVEIVRLLLVLLATTAGYEVAAYYGKVATPLGGITIGFGASFGYVSGGLLGRRLLRSLGSVEARVAAPYSAPELLTGGIGAVLAGIVSALVGLSAVGFLPGRWGWPVFGLIVWISAYTGFRIASRQSAELLALAGLSPRPLVTASRLGGAEPHPEAVLLDTSILIDGRLLQVARSGFLRGDLLVPRFVLDELQGIADAQETQTRRKGRRGLETLDVLRRDERLRVQVLDDELPEIEEVDSKLVALASRLEVRLMTNDQALASVAEVQGVRCLNVDLLAKSLRAVYLPGQQVQLFLSREGREPGQAIGFLDDGSMVVVSEAASLIGEEVEVRLLSSSKTSVGRMFFASLSDEEAESAPISDDV